jgi:hypothetical protein
MKLSVSLLILMALLHGRAAAQVGVYGVVNATVQNTVQGAGQPAYFGNTDFRVSPTIGLSIQKTKALHLINVSLLSSNVRIIDRGYFHTLFLSAGYTRFIPKEVRERQVYVGYGLDVSTSVTQTRSSYTTLTTLEEGGFGEVIKFTPYVQSRIPLTTSATGLGYFLDVKAGVDFFGISQGNGTYNSMYFMSFGLGFLKETKKR